MRYFILAASPLAFALAACGSKTTADEATAAADPEATATASMAAVAGDTMPMPLTAQAFVDAAAASDMFEIESAKIAMGAKPAEPIMAFARMMQRDHQASTENLKKAANAPGGPTVPASPKLTPEQEGNLAALRSAGPNTGQVYVSQQLAAHQQALAMLKTYAASGDNQALMDFANKTAPVVSHHLEEVQKLQ